MTPHAQDVQEASPEASGTELPMSGTLTRAGLLMRKSSFWRFWEVNTHVPQSITQVIPNCTLVESAIGKKLDSVFKEYTGNFLWFRHWAWIQELAV